MSQKIITFGNIVVEKQTSPTQKPTVNMYS